MIARLLTAAAMLCVATPALAQGNAASPYASLQDRPTCTRDELKAATTAYVKAQQSGSLAGLKLAPNAHFLENMVTVDRGAGLWNTALPVAHSMSFHDTTRCKTFTEVIVTQGAHQYVIGTRLYLHQGQVIRVDSLVTDKGDWLFNANAYLKYSAAEDWGPIHPYHRSTPAEMIAGSNAYLDGFADKFTDIPWGIPCARLEGGGYTNRDGKADASCEIGMPPGVLYIVNRDYLVDEELGVINIFCRFGNSTSGMPDSHTFRYIDGKIRAIHTLSVNMGTMPSPQADDNGAIVRNQGG